MSRWAQRTPSTNSARKSAPMIVPASPPPTFRRSATGLFRSSRYSGTRGRHGPDGPRAARHVVLHRLHGLRRLERESSGIEGDGLADERDARARVAGGVVQLHEARLLAAAARHGEQAGQVLACDALLVP